MHTSSSPALSLPVLIVYPVADIQPCHVIMEALGMARLVLLRHGQSQWNLENRFTGWVDVPLSELGVEEARRAGRQLREEGLRFDVAYTSVLKRAIKTLWLALEELDQMYLPVHKSWRVNERMYGSLQGLNKAETA